MKLLLWAIFISVSFWCTCSCQKQVSKSADQSSDVVQADSAGIIGKIVADIEAYESIESAHIGEAGSPSKQYANYQRLLRIASNDQLVGLTDHKSPAVRCYSFQGLSDNGSEKIFPVILRHLADTALVQVKSGCLVASMYAGDYFIDVLARGNTDPDKYKLRPDEQKFLDSVLLYDKSVLINARSSRNE